MPIRFECNVCSHTVQFSSRLSGTTVVCPSCKEPIRVPGQPLAPPMPDVPPQTPTPSIAEGADVVHIKIRITDPIQLYINLWRRRSRLAAGIHVAIIGAVCLYLFGPRTTAKQSSATAVQSAIPQQTADNTPVQEHAIGTIKECRATLQRLSIWHVSEERSVLRGRPLQKHHFSPDASKPDEGLFLFCDEQSVVRGLFLVMHGTLEHFAADEKRRGELKFFNDTNRLAVKTLLNLDLDARMKSAKGKREEDESEVMPALLCTGQGKPVAFISYEIETDIVLELISYTLEWGNSVTTCRIAVIVRDFSWWNL